MSIAAPMRVDASSSKGRSIRLDVIGDGEALLTLDGGDGVFLFDRAMLEQLATHAAQLATRTDLRAVFVRGTGGGTWCGGADLDAFGELAGQDAVREVVAAGQDAFSAWATLPVPTVALLDGVALGGGFELALACSRRAASESARVGLPEVMLGIIPAWGGCTRLTRLVGAVRALEAVTTGRTYNAVRALRAGLVDSVVPRALLLEEGRRLARSAARKPKIATTHRLLAATGPGRMILRTQARKKILAATSGHYPAPLAAVDVITAQHGLSIASGLELERRTIAPLATGAVARSLLRVFKMTRPSARPAVLRAAHADPPPGCVGVVGAGVMGGAIARLLCAKGIAVRLVDPSDDALVRVRKALADDLERKSKSGDITRPEARRRLLLLAVATTPSGLSGADLVIEAVPERADLKRDVLAALAKVVGPTTVVASNTSSFPVHDLAAWFPDPARLVGLHFFNPVDKLPLVEIIRGGQTSDDAVRAAAKVAMELGKTPIVVGDGPGFLVNRLFTPYLRAACTSVLDGTPMKRIDDAVEAWGLAMGPFRMMDMIGLDVLDDVGRNLAARGLEGSHPLLTAVLARGFKGRKAGRGFYVWKGDGRVPNPAIPELAGRPTTESPAAVAARLLDVLATEARAAIADGTVESKDDLDLASILGMGFPAWRGGLAHALLGGGG